MITPTPRAVLLLAAGVPLALLPSLVAPALWPLWASVLIALLLLLIADAALALPAGRLRLDARPPATLFMGGRDALELAIAHGSRRRVAFDVVCDLSETLEAQPARRSPIGVGSLALSVPLVPLRRGIATIHSAWLRWRGPLGLLEFTERRRLGLTVAVLPDIRAVRGAALRFSSNRQFLSGLKVERYVGDGSEFEALREHRSGLDARSMDWKASARHNKLLSREYRAERNHTVVLALDTGYLMREPLEGMPKLDHAINASLLLAYVALKTGDHVALFAFDERVRLLTEAYRGTSSFHRLHARTAKLDYSRAETNFTLGLTSLHRKLRRRCLVVLLTDFVDSVTAELMVDTLGRMARNHVVLFVSLRDAAIEALALAEPSSLDRLNRAMTATDLLRERELVLSRLRRAGIHSIDARPAAVSTSLINRYLDIKRRELV